MNSVETMPGGIESSIQRVDPYVTGSDLPLTRGQVDQLHAIAMELLSESRVVLRGPSDWSDRHGDVALFVGPRSTGKTTAAKALARELGTQLIRLKLVQIFSEYQPETEKNLEAVFHAATNAGAVILFDEADALFGNQSDVGEIDDRLADIDADWLVRRIEAYPGLVILGCLKLPAHWEKMSRVVYFGPPAGVMREG
jgi:DNA polymerase III delta prime subunit